MVSISSETAEQIEARLVQVISEAELVVHDGSWWFEESDVPPVLTPEVLAVVRDEEVWSSLVPAPEGAGADGTGAERFGLFSFHFPHAADNSGFVGWLASHLKHELGTGVFVVCGSNTSRGGIFDYWGCPDTLLADAVAVVKKLRARGATA